MMKPMVFALATLLAPAALAQEVSYTVDGTSYTGHYAAAAEAPKGLVLIVHDWDGLTDYEIRRAEMLADMGYDAFALDMFGDETPTQTVEHRRAATGALYTDRDKMRRLIAAGLDQARGQSQAEGLVVMGYCFGGAVTLEMARSDMGDQAAGYATFHGGLTTPDGQEWNGDEPAVLVLHGGADSSITMQDVATLSTELEAASVPYKIEVYSGAPHAFTVFGSSRYDERADTESWQAFSDFLSENLGG